MRIGVVQLESIHADVEGNIARHAQVIDRAAAHGAELLVFPELSLTQYDPTIADEMATTPDDPRFQPLQRLADRHHMTICAGMPLRAETGNTIAMLIFQPQQPVGVYSKYHLAADEKPFFVPGPPEPEFALFHETIAFAICYEISVPEHAKTACDRGASVYIASVAKTHAGADRATQRLATIAREHGMTVFMSNCVGPCEDTRGGGGSAVWTPQGELLTQMDDTQQGVILYDAQMPEQSPEMMRVFASSAAAHHPAADC